VSASTLRARFPPIEGLQRARRREGSAQEEGARTGSPARRLGERNTLNAVSWFSVTVASEFHLDDTTLFSPFTTVMPVRCYG
jgi:hypothetical protein